MKCPYCGAEVQLKQASFIYHGNRAKKYANQYVWVCSNYPKCNSYVGCRKDTIEPMGVLANPRLRTLRIEAHKQFELVQKSGNLSKREAYKWLSKSLEIPLSECHIGMFNVKTCQKTIYLCKGYLSRES